MTQTVTAKILEWLGPDRSDASIERLARWMRDALHLGSITACRALIREALEG